MAAKVNKNIARRWRTIFFSPFSSLLCWFGFFRFFCRNNQRNHIIFFFSLPSISGISWLSNARDNNITWKKTIENDAKNVWKFLLSNDGIARPKNEWRHRIEWFLKFSRRSIRYPSTRSIFHYLHLLNVVIYERRDDLCCVERRRIIWNKFSFWKPFCDENISSYISITSGYLYKTVCEV